MTNPAKVLESCRVGKEPIYIVGTFTSGVTVLSQQTRALNLAWALVESRIVECRLPGKSSHFRKKIAVVGAGFAGLTVAAALLEKGADATIYIFEERDTLLPLQQGSDSRWLHPQIYNWPAERSEVNVAMLPILNWSAARASDVVVQILTDWQRVVSSKEAQVWKNVNLFCNARHLQIHEANKSTTGPRIEWVGERRNPENGTIADNIQPHAIGASEEFDIVILAVGFGLERGNTISYWRNEVLSQPSLDQPRRTYLVSGQGDGALIDLLRLRVSQYRQDRILGDLFAGKDSLFSEIRKLQNRYSSGHGHSGLFKAFEQLGTDAATKNEMDLACDELRRRLRRDTEVILHLRKADVAGLFEPQDTKTSFQNKFLVYLLYKCGGFIPTHSDEASIIEQYSISESCIIRRHGTRREEQFQRLLSTKLFQSVKRRLKSKVGFSLSDDRKWDGGYFGFPGTDEDASRLPDEEKKAWRKEYLPGPTSLLATALSSSIVGCLKAKHPRNKRLRVTLHRAIAFGTEEVLQQACDYQGVGVAQSPTGGRTFPANNATIGLAYKTRKIIRSARGIDPALLRRVTESLNLSVASSRMADEVGFVLAIPLLEPEDHFTAPKPVVGVIYIDSQASQYYIDDREVRALVTIAQAFLDSLESAPRDVFGRVTNFPLAEPTRKPIVSSKAPDFAKKALEVLSIEPPTTHRPFSLNYDYSDFVATHTVPTGTG